MAVTLSPDQLAWTEARGDCGGVDAAARDLLQAGTAEHEAREDDDMARAKPLVDEALAEVARGEAMTLEAFEAHMAARMAALVAWQPIAGRRRFRQRSGGSHLTLRAGDRGRT